MVRPIGGLAAIAMAQAVDRAEIRLAALLTDPGTTSGDGGGSGDADESGAVGSAGAGESGAVGSAGAGESGDGGGDALLRAGKAAIGEAMRIAEAGGRLDDDEAAWLTVLLLDLRCRDHAWQRTDNAPWQQELWLDLTRRGEPGLLAPVATLLAWCAWRSGNGVLAGAALRRALLADPAYSLAHLLTEALDQGLPPDTIHPWPAR
jgi:hypothetical protein